MRLLSRHRCQVPCGAYWFHSDLPLKSWFCPCHDTPSFPTLYCIWTHNVWRDRLLSHHFGRNFFLSGRIFFTVIFTFICTFFHYLLGWFPRVKLWRERESSKHSQNTCMILRSFAIKFVKEFCRKMAVKGYLSSKMELSQCGRKTIKMFSLHKYAVFFTDIVSIYRLERIPFPLSSQCFPTVPWCFEVW